MYDQASGLPWSPVAYSLTGPDGTRYQLNAQGQVTQIDFADGQQWLVSDAGIAAVDSTAQVVQPQRIDFHRDTQNRIDRITGPQSTDGAPTGYSTAISYRYDPAGQLNLVRQLGGSDLGQPVIYDAQGRALATPPAAYLGAAVNWIASPEANTWTGNLSPTSGTATSIAFAVRESELASSIKTPGAQGAVIVAVQLTSTDPTASLALGTTLNSNTGTLLGTYQQGNTRTYLLRITQAGMQLLNVTGAANAQASLAISLAGDLNGDGQVTTADRQVLFANTGWRANRAPVTATTLPSLSTHTDLAAHIQLGQIAQDNEGDPVFWRVLGASHGTARLSTDGQSLFFTPEAGYSGSATIQLQADDGYAQGAPIEITANVSGAKLLAIHLNSLPPLQAGQSLVVRATGDFEDAKGVDLSTSGSYLSLTSQDLAAMHYAGRNPLRVDDSRDRIQAIGSGSAVIQVSHTDATGTTLKAVAALQITAASTASSDEDEGDSEAPLVITPDVYPGTLALTPGATRQLKVHITNPNSDQLDDVHTGTTQIIAAQAESIEHYQDPDTGESFDFTVPAITEVSSGTRYVVSDDSIASVSADGLITALRAGSVTISILHLARLTDGNGLLADQIIGQSDITLTVQVAQLTDDDASTPAPRTVAVDAASGGVVSSATGETLMIGAGVLKQDAQVAISRIDINHLEAITGLAPPSAEVFETLAPLGRSV